MKSLLLTEVFPPKTGGSGRWFWEIYRRLPREDVVVAAGEHANQAGFDRTHDLHVVRLPLAFSTWGFASVRGFKEYMGLAKRLKRLVDAKQVDIVHSGKCLPEGFLAWLTKRWTGVPYIVYVHGEELNVALGSRELRWLTRRVLVGANCVIANSKNTNRILRDEWDLPEHHIRVLHPGVY